MSAGRKITAWLDMDGLWGLVVDYGGSLLLFVLLLLLLLLLLLTAHTKVGWHAVVHGDLEFRLLRDGGCGEVE